MTVVHQSGLITPGHVALWTTTGVIEDGGTIAVSQRNVLASARGVNFNTTNDQPIAIPQRVTAFQLTGIIVTNASVSLTTAVGGFYPAAGQAGLPIVAASQNYAGLTTSQILTTPMLTAFGQNTRFSSVNLGTIAGFLNIWFSLTTAQGAPASADIYLLGVDLS